MARFIQIHTLTSYPASLLNRDDVGFAKRVPFGSATRTRVSSQCLKRHWRTFEGAHSLGEAGPTSIRSRLTFERYVYEPLLREGVDKPIASAVTEALMAYVLGESEKKKAKDDDGAKAKGRRGAKKDDTSAEATEAPEASAKGGPRTAQVTVLGRPEVDYFLSVAREIAAEPPSPDKLADAIKRRFGKEGEKNLKAIKNGGLDAAMFGRMVTSDVLARGDAAVHVAHAMTVHGELAETDYFSAVDDLLKGGDDESLGSGHIGTAELTTGLFYGYVVVDVPLLVSNLTGCDRKDWEKADRDQAADLVRRLVHLVSKVSPGAKLGSTAPHSYAQCVFVEAGDEQPRVLANAFLEPVQARGDLLANAYRALDEHLEELDGMYGATTARAVAAVDPKKVLTPARFGERRSLDAVAAWAAERVGGGA